MTIVFSLFGHPKNYTFTKFVLSLFTVKQLADMKKL